ncbi:MAG: cytochrome c biogenesis protein ResB [Candidatus Firestonebacteria bacterium]
MIKKLASIKFTIVLFVIIAITSIVGTLIIQQADVDFLKQRYGVLFQIFNFLGIFDLYHSWWFIVLLVLLTLNILTCSIDRLGIIFRQIISPPIKVELSYITQQKFNSKIKFKTAPNLINDKISEGLEKFGYAVLGKDENVFGHKGAWSRIGVILVHFSFFLILVGAAIGGIFGVKGNIEIAEGEKVSQFYSRNSQIPYPLDFSIYLKKFTVEYYPDTQRPKSFISEVEISEKDKVVLDKKIEVNHPLKYKKFSFYQSSFGTSEKVEYIALTVKGVRNKEVFSFKVKLDEEFNLPKTDFKAKVEDFLPDFAMDEHMKPFSKSEESNNPAVLISLFKNDKFYVSFWAFKNFPEYHVSKGLPYNFYFNDFKQVYYSGLQVTKDPGVPFIYIGSGLLLLGLMFSLLSYYRRVWIKIDKDTIYIGGYAHRNPVHFEKEFNQIIDKFKQT